MTDSQSPKGLPALPGFRVARVAATEMPQRLVYLAMHTDYSEEFCPETSLPEDRCGQIAVERLLKGNRGHYGCYSADTSVMTRRGWVLWPDVLPNDELLAVDPATGTGRFERPTRLICQPVEEGDYLYHAQSQRIDLLVTHDHRMIASRIAGGGKRGVRKWSDWMALPTHKVAGKAVRYMTAIELEEGERSLPSDIPAGVAPLDALRIAGFYYGDGVRSCNLRPRTLRFRLRRERKINFLEEAGSAVGLLEPKSESRYSLRCGELAAWVESHFRSPNGKTVPSWLLRLPKAEFLAFLEGLRNSDGTKVKYNPDGSCKSWTLHSVEASALSLIQATAVVNGISCFMYLGHPNEGPGHENHRPCWCLHFGHDRRHARFEAAQKGRTRGSESVVAYSGNVYCATVSTGALMVKRNNKPVVSGNCLEHPQLSLLLRADHNTIMQLRTHRVGVSFDVQSMRYTGERMAKLYDGELQIEDVFYIRPPGTYRDRQGDPYEWTADDAEDFGILAFGAAADYARMRQIGVSEEHARFALPTCYYQNAMVSGSLRFWLHLLDVRSKADAQDEVRVLMDMVAKEVRAWVPEIFDWYASHRLGKALLAP